MKKSTKVKTLLGNGLLPIAAGFMLMPSFFFAQTAKQAESIKKQTNLKGLNAFKKNLTSRAVTTKMLKSQAEKMNIPFSGKEGNKLFQLQGFSKKNGTPMYYITYNAEAAVGNGASKLHSSGGIFGLDGEDIVIHEWDGAGANEDHREFEGRVMQVDKPSSNHEHSAHVAGTLVAAGIDGKAKGMAPKAYLFAYDWDNDTEEMIDAIAEGAIISNHSYGVIGGFEYGPYSGRMGWHWFGDASETEYVGYGHYNSTDLVWDLISLQGPYYLPVKAAGNSRGGGPEPGQQYYEMVDNGSGTKVWQATNKNRPKNGGEFGYDTILNGSSGKNVLVVGAAEKILSGYKQPSDVKVAEFSVFGPTDDGRIKPDIVGIGVGIYSTHAASNDLYWTSDGTSMAAPNVTGSLALVQEHYRKLYGTDEAPFMKAATLKGLALHTADEAGEYDGPDYKHGWGLLNVFRAVQTLSDKDKYAAIEEARLAANGVYEKKVTASGDAPLKVTISWDDAVLEKIPEYTLNNRALTLINDLDIRVSDGETEFLPWILNPESPAAAATTGDNFRDNVEQIVIPNAVKGKEYTIRVSHKNALRTNEIDANGDLTLIETDGQDFSMVVTGINNGVTKDLALASIELPDVMQYSEQTPVKVKVKNLSQTSLSGARLEFKLINNDNANIVEFSGTQSLSDIAAGAELEQTITVNLNQSFVNYTLAVEVVVDGDEVESNNKQSTVVYGIVSDLTKEGTKSDYDFEHSMVKIGWTSQDGDGDGRTWREYEDADYARTGNSFITSFPDTENEVNDWAFTNPLKLKAGEEYRVIFNVRKVYNEVFERLQLAIGEQPNAAAMATLVGEEVDVQDGYTRYVYTFTAAKDGIHYIGFNHKQTAGEGYSYAISLDDVSIQFAKGKPATNFYAPKRSANGFEALTFINETETHSSTPVTTYEWSFSPDTVEFAEGDKNSKEPKVIFKNEGNYNVTLKSTNAKGEDILTRNNYISIANSPIQVDFTVSQNLLYEGQTTQLVDLSVGSPMPNAWEWTVTPSEEVEFVNGTSATSQMPYVKFNQPGLYDIKLKAKSPVDTKEIETKQLIEVRQVYLPVKEGSIALNREVNQINVNWNRPDAPPVYEQGFEYSGAMPDGFLTFDEDGNTIGWDIMQLRQYAHSGSRAVYSPSRNQEVSNWLVTSVVPGGNEELRFWHRNLVAENVDVYIVKAKASGEALTLDEVKAGEKIYQINTATGEVYKQVKIDVSRFTEPYHIAFHHNMRRSANNRSILIDEIQVGMRNGEASGKVAVQPNNANLAVENGVFDPILSYQPLAKQNVENTIAPMEVLDIPRLSGYEIVKKGTTDSVVKTTSDTADKSYQENITANGVYTYDIVAVYNDGRKSEPVSVTIDITNLSTSDVKNEGLKIYPNPSDGRFVVEAGSGVTSLKAEVYDMSGKQIYKQDFRGSKADLNLTQYPKGVYILNLVDNNGKKQSAKLMIK
ncbi:peptidase S8 [Bergeyella porcorum]|uniref:Peptidase S8 n=1 Tax=Bergeyella porcorum TaxID=1735111 RepID=A0AAU0F0V9_9FLAO